MVQKTLKSSYFGRAAMTALVSTGALCAPAIAADRYEYRASKPGLRISPSDTPAAPPALTYVLQASTQSLAFEPRVVGSSEAKSVVVSNTGTGNLTIATPVVAGSAFSSTSDCGSSLASGQSCTVTVQFTPRAIGDAVGTLLLASNATAGNVSVQLTGRGTADPYLAAVIPFDGADGQTSIAERVSGQNLVGTTVALSTTSPAFGTASAYLNGSALATTANSYTIGTQDFTVEVFIKPTRATGQFEDILGSLIAGNNSSWRLVMNSSGVLSFATWNNLPWVISSSASVTRGAWNHVAVARSAGTLRMYLNGALVASTAASSPSFAGNTIAFGQAGPAYTDGRFMGYIDDFRLSLGTARYTGATYAVPSYAHPVP